MQYFLPVFLLLIANIFMTLAWYGHLKLNQMGISSNWPLIAVILFSWGIALIEYIFQVPANKMGFIGNGGPFTLLQLKVIQEALSIFVFCVIANILFQGEKVAWNHLAAFGCLIMAVVFVFWKN
ncbi:MAG: DMT family protein [Bacteroidales bacterium]|nr:DMT family protein [Bacteroidales bacterium]